MHYFYIWFFLSSGQDSALPPQETRIQSLVGELRSRMSRGVAEKKEKNFWSLHSLKFLAFLSTSHAYTLALEHMISGFFQNRSSYPLCKQAIWVQLQELYSKWVSELGFSNLSQLVCYLHTLLCKSNKGFSLGRFAEKGCFVEFLPRLWFGIWGIRARQKIVKMNSNVSWLKH